MSVVTIVIVVIPIVIFIVVATKSTTIITIITIITLRSVQLKFKQEFFGIVYADYDRNSACKVTANSTS